MVSVTSSTAISLHLLMIIPGCNPQTFRHGSFGLNYLYVDKTISKAIVCLTHEARF